MMAIAMPRGERSEFTSPVTSPPTGDDSAAALIEAAGLAEGVFTRGGCVGGRWVLESSSSGSNTSFMSAAISFDEIWSAAPAVRMKDRM